MTMWLSALLGCCLALLTPAPSLAQRDGYCLASDYDPYLMFSTKSAYELVKGKDNNQHVVPYCRPIQFWSFNRHGTRLPSLRIIEELSKLTTTRDDIIANYEVRRTAPDQGRLCNQDLENLKLWFWNKNFTKNYANDLTYQGYDDLKYLAKRWQTKFPDLLSTMYSAKDYVFRFTDKRRTKDSFRAYLDGLFGRVAANEIRTPQVIPNDTLLQPYEFCTEWIKQVGENPDTAEQMKQFKKKEEYQTMIQNVSNHLGYKYPLDENIIDNIYEMCRFDKAWELNKNSPWCAAFSKDQLKLLEYAEDLMNYYDTGYGNKLNKKIGCTPIKDFMEKFTKMVEHPEEEQPKATVYFTHSRMIELLITALGTAEDAVPLTSDNYHTSNIQRRLWRTSLIDPFAANLVAVLYKCQEGDTHRVMFFLNEKPLDFSDCRVGLCSWDVVKKKFGDVADSCNLDFCSQNSVGANSASFKLHFFISFLVLIFTTKLRF